MFPNMGYAGGERRASTAPREVGPFATLLSWLLPFTRLWGLLTATAMVLVLNEGTFRTNFIIKKFQVKQPEDSPYIDCNINVTTEPANKQFLNYNINVPFSLDANYRLETRIDYKQNIDYLHLFNIREANMCEGLNKYLGQFWFDIKSRHMANGRQCPIPKARYLLVHYPMKFQTLALQTFPFGELRFNLKVICGVGVDFAVHHYETGYYLIAISIMVFWLEITWAITLFLQLCIRNESNKMWRCWGGVLWISGWKRALLYLPLSVVPILWPHKLWLAYVAGGMLIALALFHFLLTFKGRKRRKRKDRLLNGEIDSFESTPYEYPSSYSSSCDDDSDSEAGETNFAVFDSRFEEVTDVLDDALPEPMPGSSHSISDTLVDTTDTILEI